MLTAVAKKKTRPAALQLQYNRKKLLAKGRPRRVTGRNFFVWIRVAGSGRRVRKRQLSDRPDGTKGGHGEMADDHWASTVEKPEELGEAVFGLTIAVGGRKDVKST